MTDTGARQISGRTRPSGRRREQVLGVVTNSQAPIGIAELADQLDVHPNTVRFHLDHLTKSGLVEMIEHHSGGPGRPAQRYRAVRSMDRSGPRNYHLLARMLVEEIAAGPGSVARAVAAGQRWGQQVASQEADTGNPVGHLVRVLEDSGFAPTQGRFSIDLHHCPFLDLSETGDRTVCAVHLGLMHGALRTWQANTVVDRLEPFAEPDLCRAHLRPVTTRN
ncbi:MAG: helix-turn-helix transcriptional regulator [Beutenbergiaceae bacterium]